jgi:hypothetical protein
MWPKRTLEFIEVQLLLKRKQSIHQHPRIAARLKPSITQELPPTRRNLSEKLAKLPSREHGIQAHEVEVTPH